MLDEIDKLGMDFRGDPAAALLEVLDPEQNGTFRDHYLDVAFDLSRVLFITTANVMDTVPPALRDRMEMIPLAGYTEEEKVKIAQKHLIPKQAREHGLEPAADVTFTPESLRLLARGYTREAGVRNLEREIASVCRKITRRRAEGETAPVVVTPDVVTTFLGVPRFEYEELEECTRVPGVAVGLAWTPAGGDLLLIEATKMKGARTLTLTGQLGDVMKESAQAALSWVRSHATELGISSSFWETADIHVHIPAGAIPKGGPLGGHHADDGSRVVADGPPRAVGTRDDGRGEPFGPGPARGRHQGKGSGGTPRRRADGHPSSAQREEPAGRRAPGGARGDDGPPRGRRTRRGAPGSGRFRGGPHAGDVLTRARAASIQ